MPDKARLIDLGLKRLKDGSFSCAVIFIHGILSDGERCWKHENGTYWPELLASWDQSKSLSIFVYTYESDIFSADYSLDDVVDDLTHRLRNAGVERYPRIIFVCHTMGGLVARRYLVRRQLTSAKSTTNFGLLFVASPSLGSDWANWLTPIAQFFQHSQADALRFSKNNRWLDTLDRDFRDLKESERLQLRGRELIEDKFIVSRKLFFSPKIVERISGARYFGEALKIAGSDHFSIAKPKDVNALQHTALCELIKTVMHLPVPQESRATRDRVWEPPFDGMINLANWFSKLNRQFYQLAASEQRQLIKSMDRLRKDLYTLEADTQLLLDRIPDERPDDATEEYLGKVVHNLQDTVNRLRQSVRAIGAELRLVEAAKIEERLSGGLRTRGMALNFLEAQIESNEPWDAAGIRSWLKKGLAAVKDAQLAATTFCQQLARV
jgi:hypothetical protein